MYIKSVLLVLWFEVINCSLCPVAVCTFPTSSLTQEGKLVLYEESSLFFLLKLSASAFTANASTVVTFPVALTNSGIPVWDFFVFF